MEITKTTPEEFLDSLPSESQADMRALDKMITKASKGTERVMWEGKFWGGSDQRIIGYGRLVYVGSNKKEVEWFKAGLALQKNYITVFVVAVQGGEYVVEKYKGKLGKVKMGKSTVSFKKLEDVNVEMLGELLGRAFE